MPDISEIKNKRKKAEITQSELAKETGVSQSLIAKIEAGAVSPSYGNAKRLFDFFESIHEKSGAKAAELMTKRVIGISPEMTLKQAIRVMKKNALSQLPVIEEGKNKGTVSEKNLLEKMNNAEDINKAVEMPVSTIMSEAMPTVSEEIQLSTISALLQQSPGVIVAKNGKITGIITKSDLLNRVLAKK